VLIAGGFSPETAKQAVDEKYKDYDVVIVFGRYFISNPDLVFRIQGGVPLRKYERTYFYTPHVAEGYTTYLYSSDYLAKAAA
jgi:NADPH2 dehydrogenase